MTLLGGVPVPVVDPSRPPSVTPPALEAPKVQVPPALQVQVSPEQAQSPEHSGPAVMGELEPQPASSPLAIRVIEASRKTVPSARMLDLRHRE